jgi:AraC-like DNA-binding protein
MFSSSRFKNILKSPRVHILSAAAITIALCISSQKNDLILIPSANTDNCSAYSDATSPYDTGNSIIHRFRADPERTVFEYTLNGNVPYPYAGFQWNFGDSFLNIKDYGDLMVTVDPESTTVKSFLIILQVFCDGFSEISNSITLRFLTKELFLRDGVMSYTIPVSGFVTPDWWFKRLATNEYSLGKPDLSQTVILNIQSSADSVGTRNVIVIKDLRFSQANRFRRLSVYLGIFCIFLMLYLAIRIVVGRKSKKQPGPVPIQYEKINIENGADQEERLITEFIGKNFTNPEFSLLRMSMDIGVPTYKISSVIKKLHNLTFKQYLNTIRIAEAKRLLKTSDLQISQIAYRVGYSTTPHFNRIFKTFTSQSPNTYRNASDF